MNKISCPRCGSENTVFAGFYMTKLYQKRHRVKCKDCERHFIIGKLQGVLTLKQEKEICILSNKINRYPSLYDPRKRKTFSLREIAKIMKISKTFVQIVLKNNKKQDGTTKTRNKD